MKKIVFEIETITPMFLAGADQRRAELRAPSIKGLMRFWWRALQAEPDLKKLREKESKIFGSADEKTGASGVSLRVLEEKLKYKPNFREFGIKKDYEGIGYLLYSTFIQKNRVRGYIEAGSKFHIVFTSKNDEKLKQAIASFWLLANLGGIGTRGRRGGGNIAVTSTEDEYGLLLEMGIDFTSDATTPESLSEWLMKNISVVKRIIAGGHRSFVTQYSNLSFSRCIIGEGNERWTDALNEIGTIFKDFRSRNKHRVFEAACFGIPVMHNNSKTTIHGLYNNRKIRRRSSPVIIRVIKSGNRYFWLTLRLSGEFLPEGGVLTDGRRTSRPDYTMIDEFWNILKRNREEIVLSKPKILDSIVEKLVEESNARKIILFGSRARGDAHSRADIDIAVETEVPVSQLTFNGSIDIVDIKHADKSLIKNIEKEGVLLYERKG